MCVWGGGGTLLPDWRLNNRSSIRSIFFIGISRRALCVLTTRFHPINEEELNRDKELADWLELSHLF